MGEHYLPNSPNKTAFPVSSAGYPFVFAFAFITLIFALLDVFLMSFVFLFLTFFTCFFFRDPDRLVPIDPHLIVSPADGRIIDVCTVDSSYLDGKCCKISIFMSIFNVHVNRAPFAGRVEEVNYYPGKYFSANLNKASSSNERNSILLKNQLGIKICFVQIAGLVARRIICAVQPKDLLEKGQRFGLICFGSRLDVYLPLNIKVCVNKGDKVMAGSSVIGELLDGG